MQIRGTRRRRSLDTGFALSDHADWNGIMSSVEATGAEAIGVTHGAIGPVVRYLTEKGKKAFAVPTRWEGEAGAEEGGGNGEADGDAHRDGPSLLAGGEGDGACEGGSGEGVA
jgi:putative mRNA 3-end processing factor